MSDQLCLEDPGLPPSEDADAKARTHPAPYRMLRIFAAATAGLVLAAAGGGWLLIVGLDRNIRTDHETPRILEEFRSERPSPTGSRAQNVLLLGSDEESGVGGERADTTMLLHLSADRSRAVFLSVPRELLVDIPVCRSGSGTLSEAQRAQFDSSFRLGGTACTIRTFEQLTGVRVDHYVIAEFSGFKKVVDAVGGVSLRIDESIHDPETNITLEPGRQRLDGSRALVYVRTRLGAADGSDTQRTDRQQRFTSALMDRVTEGASGGRLDWVYPLLDGATSALVCDPGLDSLNKLYELLRDAKGLSAGTTSFVIPPRRPAEVDPNLDELVQPQADELFRQLRNDEELT